MDSVLHIITVLLALLLMLLTVPITVAFRIERSKEVMGQLTFNWLFGLVRYRKAIPGDAQGASQPKRKRRGKSGKSKRVGNGRTVWTLLKQPPFRRRTVRFIKGIIGAIQARDFYLHLRIGLGDPADTGRLWGLLGPLAGIVANIRRAEVRIEPDFTDPVLEIESHGELRLIPLQFIGLTTAFVVSPATLHAWRTLRRSNA